MIAGDAARAEFQRDYLRNRAAFHVVFHVAPRAPRRRISDGGAAASRVLELSSLPRSLRKIQTRGDRSSRKGETWERSKFLVGFPRRDQAGGAWRSIVTDHRLRMDSVDSHFMRCGACCFLRGICVFRGYSLIRVVSRSLRLAAAIGWSPRVESISWIFFESSSSSSSSSSFVAHLRSPKRHASRRPLPRCDRRRLARRQRRDHRDCRCHPIPSSRTRAGYCTIRSRGEPRRRETTHSGRCRRREVVEEPAESRSRVLWKVIDTLQLLSLHATRQDHQSLDRERLSVSAALETWHQRAPVVHHFSLQVIISLTRLTFPNGRRSYTPVHGMLAFRRPSSGSRQELPRGWIEGFRTDSCENFFHDVRPAAIQR